MLAEVARQRLIAFSRQDYPDYHESLATLFAAVRIKPDIAEEHDSAASLIAAIEAGSGVAIVTESMACVAGPRLKLVRISPVPAPFVIGAAWPKTALSPAAQNFKMREESGLHQMVSWPCSSRREADQSDIFENPPHVGSCASPLANERPLTL